MTKSTKPGNSRWRKVYRRFNLWVVWTVLIAAFLFAIFYERIVYTTPVGSASIHWLRVPSAELGNSVGPLPEGLHLIPPWDVFYTYEVRLQEHQEDYQVLSKDGLHFDMTVRFRWRVLTDNIVNLNQRIGVDYLNRLLIPEIGSIARDVVASHKATSLYSEKRSEIQQEIYNDLTDVRLHNYIGSRDDEGDNPANYIALQDLLITYVSLPEKMQSAIEAKLMEAEKVEEYSYRVQREALESERKRVEAQGIRAFQEIVTPAISESYLRWRGIEATLSLAESRNSKIVVIGNSETGLPLIFDTRTSLSEEMEGQNQSAMRNALPEKFGAGLGAGAGNQQQAVSPAKAGGASGDGAKAIPKRPDKSAVDASGATPAKPDQKAEANTYN